MGLGGYPNVSLVGARAKAAKARELLATGGDPIADKRKAPPPTFAVAAEEFVRTREGGWSAPVAQRNRAYVRTHLADLAGVRVDAVVTGDVERVLRPLWGTPTAAFMRGFVERVLDFARVKYGLPDVPNPARYRGHLEHLLVGDGRERVSHPAMPWTQVPEFMAQLDEMDTVVSRALMLTILGGFRQVEVRELRWNEVFNCVSENAKTHNAQPAADKSGQNPKHNFPCIVIPATRYKTRREHVVPITDPMKRILHKMAPYANDPDALVFPGDKHDRPMSQHRFKALLPPGVSVHGFRTALTVWGVEAGGFTDDLMQRVLGHVVGTEVTRAYQRSDFFEQRKAVHEAWGRYLFSDNG
jgi:integrase